MHRTGRVHHDYVQIFCNNIKELQYFIYLFVHLGGGGGIIFTYNFRKQRK